MNDDRYSRQERFAPIGVAGQKQIAAASVVVIGCGALGAAACEMLCRAGIARLKIIDRDFVEYSNLQRQCLFTEADAEQRMPKVIAAKNKLSLINSSVEIEACIADLHAQNVEELLSGSDLIIDACDNFVTRHIVNDYACLHGIPWIYAACVGSYACGMTIIPGKTPCLSCIQDELPAAGDSPSCDSAGIIAPAVYAAAARQMAEALKVLSGNSASCDTRFWSSDLWTGDSRSMDLSQWTNPNCSSCGVDATQPYLHNQRDHSMQLCGRNGMQITLAQKVDLEALALAVAAYSEHANKYLVRWRDGEINATCFADGRVIIQGTQDETAARSFIDRWLG